MSIQKCDSDDLLSLCLLSTDQIKQRNAISHVSLFSETKQMHAQAE
jgi:hypothetical protein